MNMIWWYHLLGVVYVLYCISICYLHIIHARTDRLGSDEWFYFLYSIWPLLHRNLLCGNVTSCITLSLSPGPNLSPPSISPLLCSLSLSLYDWSLCIYDRSSLCIGLYYESGLCTVVSFMPRAWVYIHVIMWPSRLMLRKLCILRMLTESICCFPPLFQHSLFWEGTYWIAACILCWSHHGHDTSDHLTELS